MYVCMCVCTCVTCMCLHACMYTHVCAGHTYFVHAPSHMCTYVYVFVCIQTCVLCVGACISRHYNLSVHVCMYVSVFVCMCMCMCDVYLQKCPICMYICMHIYTQTHTHTPAGELGNILIQFIHVSFERSKGLLGSVHTHTK